ncbi:coat protein [Iocasia frigidifontis]|uniref:Coat protein n=1 Tax=Iocasia fonsfrigidae TaxID=2682810 RepID=A0A8A7KEE7_9FIRM|nr:major capsid protein [Iocasia fonsfrigidae]QTL96554.1 coat protein [Iocasia fonsfrigidae]
MAVTLVGDIIKPEVWVPYVISETPKKSALFKSGIVSQDPRIKVPSGGDTANMPFWNDLDGDAQAIQSDTALNINRIDSGKDVARVFEFGNAWSAEDLAAELAGSDPMTAIGDRVIVYWDREYQKILIFELNGVFADNVTNDDSDLVYDVAKDDIDANGAVDIDSAVILDGKQLLGDAKGKLTAIAMHSAVHTNLQKQDLIDYIPDSKADIGWGTYMGHTVIVDDDMPVADATTSGKKYTSYLFGQGAVGYDEGKPKTPVESDRNSLKGQDILIHRRKFILHPRGFKWTEGAVSGEMPTYTEIQNATNWDRIYDKKKTRVVKLVTNG